jgi:hypothetical protein
VHEIAPGFYVVVRAGRPFKRAYVLLEEGNVRETPPPCPKKLMMELKEAGSELSTREAVDIISSRLGVSRREAREVLQSLAKRYCVVVENGRVMLFD